METTKIISIALISLGLLAILESILIQVFKKQLLQAIRYFSKKERIKKLALIEIIVGLIILTTGWILWSM